MNAAYFWPPYACVGLVAGRVVYGRTRAWLIGVDGLDGWWQTDHNDWLVLFVVLVAVALWPLLLLIAFIMYKPPKTPEERKTEKEREG